MKLKNIRITDPFWQEEQELVRREVIPYQWEALNDRIPGASPSFAIHNFLAAKSLRERSRQPSARRRSSILSMPAQWENRAACFI